MFRTNSKKNFFKALLNLSRVKKTISLTVLAVFAVSCTPSEKVLTEEEIKGSGTFGGATAVQTLSSSQVKVAWEASTNENVTGYNIYDSTLKSQPRLVKTVGAESTEAVISGLSEGFLYRFRVRAVSAGGAEDNNEVDPYGIPYGGAQSVNVVSSTSVELNFNPAVATEVLELLVYCRNANEPEYVRLASIKNVATTSFTITGLLPNIDYTCRVASVVDGQEDNNENTVTFKALGRADKIVFDIEPGNGDAGSPLSAMPVVRVLDENDNIVSGGPDAEAFITLTVSVTSPTAGTVRGTATVTAVAGVAAFTDLFMQEAGIKVLTATKSDTSGAPGGFGTAPMVVDSATFNINPGNISPILTTMTVENAISPGITPVANGTDAYTVTFTLRDDFGNPVSGIRPQFASNIPGDFFSQPLSPSDSAGITTGSVATNTADTNGPTTRTLNMSSPAGFEAIQVAAPFDPGAATRLAFTAQPTNSPAGDFGLNEVRVSVQDNFGNTITSGGDASTSVSLSIANNIGGATLSGTVSRAAVNGVATFDDLGIDITANGYKLAAAGGVLTPVQSNNFNVTAGIPRVIAMTGGTSVLSGDCSTQITLELQDFGGNPANAVSNTIIQLSGLGNADLYTSAACGGAPVGTSITYTPGQSTKFLYLQSSKVENLTIIGSDSSAVLTPSSYDIFVTPSQMRMVAEAAPPAPGGTPLSVTAGQCSTAITITPLAADGSVGQVFTPTSVQVSGIVGSQAKLYSDASCLVELDETAIALSMSAPPNEDTVLYLRDPRGESLLINAVDPSGDIATISLPQEVNVLASEIEFLGPTQVVAGQCSSVFTINLQDTQSNNVPTVADTTLNVVGMSGSPSGQFYTSPSCSGGGSNSSILIPEASSSTSVYYSGNEAEILNLQITDPAGNMTASAIITLEVSPSSLFIVNPAGPDESDTSVCSEMFRVRLRDGANNDANAVSTVVANISGGGTAGKYYSDAACTSEITQLTFNPGVGIQDFYFKGHYPETGLSITVTDAGAVLTSDTQNWDVNAQVSWVGGAGQQYSAGVSLLPFRTGLTDPVSARINGVRQAFHMAMDPTKQFLYVVDRADDRIIKYDYTNMELVGWIGRLRQEGGLAITGSTLPVPSNAQCIGTTNNSSLPGWCLGGGSIGGNNTTGGFTTARGITVDDTYVYVVDEGADTVTRFNAETGAFEGWIGTKNNTNPTGPATGGPPSCNVANDAAIPGWCIGGNSRDPGANERSGDGRFKDPYSIAHDATYLYIGASGMVHRVDKATGSHQGWIGRINQTPSSNAAGAIGDCTAFGNNDQTPGWCIGGRAETDDGRDGSGGVSIAAHIVVDTPNNRLYVLNSNNNGYINEYNLTTGASLGLFNATNNIMNNAQQMFLNGGKMYVAADERLMRLDATGTLDGWMGKVANNVGMGGEPGCNALLPNDNTPGWCIGGSQKSGLDETAFINQFAIVDDGLGSLLTTSQYRPLIKKFDIATGAYQGSIGMESTVGPEWSGDLAVPSQQEGSGDNDFYSPAKPLAVGDALYVADRRNGRIKKFNKRTGELTGWIGGITTVPTGGEDPGLCTSVNPMRASPHYCTGAYPYPFYTWNDPGMIDDTANGIMEQPFGLATDGVYLYVTDFGEHRIQRFDLNNGTYGGWIGRINQSPSGGDPGCVGAPNNSFTPGWCLGGSSETGNGDGNLNSPTGIEFVAGKLYVVDRNNHRVSRYDAVTGAFQGWIGRVNAAPSSGCTLVNRGDGNVAETGWCIGGTSRATNDHHDGGGGFRFDYGDPTDITSDGVFLYVTNKRNSRLDKIALDGSFIEATRTREDSYADGWKNLASGLVDDIGNTTRHRSMPQAVHVDATHIYVSTAVPNQRRNEPAGIVKLDKATGLVIGWKGGIDPDNPPTGGDPGCLGAIGITPGWCTGGRVAAGTLPGQTSGYYGSLAGDEFFLYITDEAGHRVTRIPKQ